VERGTEWHSVIALGHPVLESSNELVRQLEIVKSSSKEVVQDIILVFTHFNIDFLGQLCVKFFQEDYSLLEIICVEHSELLVPFFKYDVSLVFLRFCEGLSVKVRTGRLWQAVDFLCQRVIIVVPFRGHNILTPDIILGCGECALDNLFVIDVHSESAFDGRLMVDVGEIVSPHFNVVG